MNADAFGPMLIGIALAAFAVARIITVLERRHHPAVVETWAESPLALVPVLGASFLYRCPVCRLWVRQTHTDAMSFVTALLDKREITCSRCASTLVALDRELSKGVSS